VPSENAGARRTRTPGSTDLGRIASGAAVLSVLRSVCTPLVSDAEEVSRIILAFT